MQFKCSIQIFISSNLFFTNWKLGGWKWISSLLPNQYACPFVMRNRTTFDTRLLQREPLYQKMAPPCRWFPALNIDFKPSCIHVKFSSTDTPSTLYIPFTGVKSQPLQKSWQSAVHSPRHHWYCLSSAKFSYILRYMPFCVDLVPAFFATICVGGLASSRNRFRLILPLVIMMRYS